MSWRAAAASRSNPDGQIVVAGHLGLSSWSPAWRPDGEPDPTFADPEGRYGRACSPTTTP